MRPSSAVGKLQAIIAALALVLAGTLVWTALSREAERREVHLSVAPGEQPAGDPAPTNDHDPDAQVRDDAVKATADVDPAGGEPAPSDMAVWRAREYLATARTMMAHGSEEPAESITLHELSLDEADPVTRAIFHEAAQAFCRGDLWSVYEALSRIADEPTPEEQGLSLELMNDPRWEVDQSYHFDPIEVVVERWRAGDYYSPPGYNDIPDFEEWWDRRERFGVNELAAHCEDQGRFEQYHEQG